MVKYRLTKKGKLVVILLCSFIVLFTNLGVTLAKDSALQADQSSLNLVQEKDSSDPKPQPEPQQTPAVQQTEPLDKLKLSIFFDPNIASISSKYNSDLESFVEAAMQYQDAEIQLEGNCATRFGNNQSKAQKLANYNLSQTRAQTVADFFKDKGINPDRLIVVSNGADKPLKDNDTLAGREFNRRVDVFFVNK